MKTLYLLHGLHTRDPHSSIGKLAWYVSPERDGLHPVILHYGYLIALLANFVNWVIARHLAKSMEKGSIGVGHSNGCTLLFEISKKVEMTGLVLVNPALDADVVFPLSLKFIHVYWSPKDDVTWLSQFVPFSDWGKMGTVGYKGDDPRVQCFNMGTQHADIINVRSVMEKWGPIIVSRIVWALSQT